MEQINSTEDDVLNAMTKLNISSPSSSSSPDSTLPELTILTTKEQKPPISSPVFDEGRKKIAESLMDSAMTQISSGKPLEAMTQFQEALRIYVKIYGYYHHSCAKTLNCIGNIFNELGEPQEALLVYIESLEILHKVFGEFHPDIASTYYNISGVLYVLGRYKEALTASEEHQQIKRQCREQGLYDTAAKSPKSPISPKLPNPQVSSKTAKSSTEIDDLPDSVDKSSSFSYSLSSFKLPNLLNMNPFGSSKSVSKENVSPKSIAASSDKANGYDSK